MVSFTGMFDTYGRNAWLRPALIVSLPLTALVVVVVTSAPTWWTSLSSLLCASGIIYFAADIVQSRGKSKEKELWDVQGGAPTTRLLRYKGSSNAALVNRYHILLKRAIPDLVIPTRAEEHANPISADQHYITVTKALIARTRDRKKYPLVFMQNYRYGFRRNMYGSRTLGILASVLSIIVACACAGLNIWLGFHISWLGIGFVLTLDVVLLFSFVFIVNKTWVRQVDEAYADRLLETLEEL
jgi:hypothetical protein